MYSNRSDTLPFADDADDLPCNTCGDYDHCDGWEARFCCTLCRYYNDDPDCSECNSGDI